MEEKVVIRNQPADYITHSVVSALMESVKADKMVEWHSIDLNRLYISDNDKIESDLLIRRGWDTQMELNLDSNAEESADRLTDHMIDEIKQTVRSICEDELGVKFADGEKIRSLRIKTEIGRYNDIGDEKYIVEFDTEIFESEVVTDSKMSGHPRIAGRRILVSWIWDSHVRNELSPEELVEEFDSNVTEKEVQSAINFAENSDSFDTRDDINSDESEASSDLATLDEIDEMLSDRDELMDVEDNRYEP